MLLFKCLRSHHQGLRRQGLSASKTPSSNSSSSDHRSCAWSASLNSINYGSQGP